ncbi:MAG: hypothetical protein LBI28_05585 [Treponema sp.]|jgi:hypothetical protein|nr:hypothetical protein [Treponema sp.]
MKKRRSQLRADDAIDSAFGHTDWHTAFFQALKMELREYEGLLDFFYDHKLTEEPLRIDCVIVKKTKDVKISKNIAAFFREYNLFEYKSPDHYVSIADFYKVYAYACLYSSIEKKAPITSLTLSFMERRYPRKLLKHLQEVRGYTVVETSEGIYTVSGDILPIQIIDSRRLSADENLWLKSLSNKLNSLEIEHISKEIVRQKKDTQINAYRKVITKANAGIIQEAMEMGRRVTLEQVIENTGLGAKWEARGKARGKAEGKAEIARKMKQAERPVSEIAGFTGLSPEAIENL